MDLRKLFLIITFLIVKSSPETYDSEVIEGLEFDDKTLIQLHLIPNNNDINCRRFNENCKDGKVEVRSPVDTMGANTDFGSPNKIFRDTEKLMVDLKTEARMLAKVTNDNESEAKYVYSLMQYFHLQFIKMYINVDPKAVIPNLYEKAFAAALKNTKSQRDRNALQLAAPVRRVASILGSVIDFLVEIIQTTCSRDLQDWQCSARYYVMLAKETNSCPNLWFHHHKVFVETLRLVQLNQKTLLDVTKVVMASVNYMTSRRGLEYDAEIDLQSNGLAEKYAEYANYINDYNYYEAYYDYLEYMYYGDGHMNNTLKYAQDISNYGNRNDNSNTTDRDLHLKNLDVNPEIIDNSMQYHDFRTTAAKDLDFQDSSDNIDIINMELREDINLKDSIINEEYKPNDEWIYGDRASYTDSIKTEDDLKDSKVPLLINSILMRNIPLLETAKSELIIPNKKQEKKNFENEVDKNRRASEDLTLGSVEAFESNTLIPDLLDDYNDEYEDFYDDLHRRGILFDSSLKFLHLYRQVLKEYLIRKARVYKLVATYQEENKLDCIMINRKPVL